MVMMVMAVVMMTTMADDCDEDGDANGDNKHDVMSVVVMTRGQPVCWVGGPPGSGGWGPLRHNPLVQQQQEQEQEQQQQRQQQPQQ